MALGLSMLSGMAIMTCRQAGELGGKIGGKSRSEAKVEAARVNGRRGGRPKSAIRKVPDKEISK